MRETRTYGSEGGEGEGSSLPLSGAFAGFLDSRLRGNDGIDSLSKCHSDLTRV